MNCNTLFALASTLLISSLPLSAMEIEEQEVNLDTLPREIQYHIFSFLDEAKDLNAVSQVNHSLKDEADTDFLWDHFYQKAKAKYSNAIESCKPFLHPSNDGTGDQFLIGYEHLEPNYRFAQNFTAEDTKPEGISWKDHYQTIFGIKTIPFTVDWPTMNRHGLSVNIAFKIIIDPMGNKYDFYQSKGETQKKLRLTRHLLAKELTFSYQKIRGYYGEAIYDKTKHFIAPLAPEMFFLPPSIGTVEAITLSWDKNHPSYFKGNIHYIIKLSDGSVIEATYLKSKGSQATYQMRNSDGKAFKKIKLSTQTHQLIDKKKCAIS